MSEMLCPAAAHPRTAERRPAMQQTLPTSESGEVEESPPWTPEMFAARYAERVHRFAVLVSPPGTDADDLAQDAPVLLRLSRTRSEFGRRGEPGLRAALSPSDAHADVGGMSAEHARVGGRGAD
jgi:hypothetical protein